MRIGMSRLKLSSPFLSTSPPPTPSPFVDYFTQIEECITRRGAYPFVCFRADIDIRVRQKLNRTVDTPSFEVRTGAIPPPPSCGRSREARNGRRKEKQLRWGEGATIVILFLFSGDER